MSEPRIVGSMRSYRDLVAIIRARLAELDITYETLDEIAGLQPGYTGKLLMSATVERERGQRSSRRMSPFIQFLIFDALGLVAHAVEDADRTEQMRKRFVTRKYRKDGMLSLLRTIELTPDLLRINGRKGGLAYAENNCASERSKNARRAAKIRWRRRRAAPLQSMA